jgi:hypothetical protein
MSMGSIQIDNVHLPRTLVARFQMGARGGSPLAMRLALVSCAATQEIAAAKTAKVVVNLIVSVVVGTRNECEVEGDLRTRSG